MAVGGPGSREGSRMAVIESAIEAPWSEDQVDCLNYYQAAGFMHPYTCPGCAAELIATQDGWRCPFDDYRQSWAHGFTADREWLNHMEQLMARFGRPKDD